MTWIPALANAAATAYSSWRSHKDQKNASKHGGSGNAWSGKSGYSEKIQNYTHDQKSMLKDMAKHSYVHLPNITKDPNYQAGTGYLQKIISQDPEMMKQFEAPVMRQFNEQIVPGLSEQFAGAGALNSSGFQQTMGQAAGSLSERLAQMRAQLGMEASQHLFGYSQLPGAQRQQEQALTMQQRGMVLGAQPYTYAMHGGEAGAGQGMMSGIGQSLPDLYNYIKGFGGGSSSSSNAGKVNSVSNSWGYNNLGSY
jgi:hypothetical protein